MLTTSTFSSPNHLITKQIPNMQGQYMGDLNNRTLHISWAIIFCCHSRGLLNFLLKLFNNKGKLKIIVVFYSIWKGKNVRMLEITNKGKNNSNNNDKDM